MGEHRQELVLAAVVLLDVAIEPGVVDGDRGAAGEVFRPARGPPGRRLRRPSPSASAIAPNVMAPRLERHTITERRPRSSPPCTDATELRRRTDAKRPRRVGIETVAGPGVKLGHARFEHAADQISASGPRSASGCRRPDLTARRIGRIDPGQLGPQCSASLVVDQGDRAEVAEERDRLAGEPARDRLVVERADQDGARLGEERRATGRLLGGGPRRLLPRQGDALLGLPLDLLRLLVEVDEDPDLGPEDLRHDGREDVVDRAERVTLGGVHLVAEGRDEDDRRVGRLRGGCGSSRPSRSRPCPAC